MGFIVGVLGAVVVVATLADMINTLITTQTSSSRFWLSAQITRITWGLARWLALRFPPGARRERILSAFAPALVLAFLVIWLGQLILGFGLLWWAHGGYSGARGFGDALYYSGVVFFTVGFGEVVPVDAMARAGAVAEALVGVLMTALVISYLPALYASYSERERKLMTLDDGTEDRISPDSLVRAWSPDADVGELLRNFESWEDWVAGILETHSTFPMLQLFRSHHRGQSWITALGLVTDAAVICEAIEGTEGRAPFWLVRRSTRLLQELTIGVDLSTYRSEIDEIYESGEQFEAALAGLRKHGLEVSDDAGRRERALQMRRAYDAQMEYLIDHLAAPRGFWGHQLDSADQLPGIDEEFGSSEPGADPRTESA